LSTKGEVCESSIIYYYLDSFSVSKLSPEYLTFWESHNAPLHIEFILKMKLICILHHRKLLVNFHTARCEQTSDNKPGIIQRCTSVLRITPRPKVLIRYLYLHKISLIIKNRLCNEFVLSTPFNWRDGL